jgi:hypothetical protein
VWGYAGTVAKSDNRKASSAEPRSLDLKQFASVEDAVAKVQPGDRYLEVAKILLTLGDELPLTLPAMFWFSMITRSQGLHEAIAREIGEENPHAVFPLIRAFAESVLLVIYVADHPGYVNLLIDRSRNLAKDGPKRKTIQALISYARDHAPGMKDVYQHGGGAVPLSATSCPPGNGLRVSTGPSPTGYDAKDLLSNRSARALRGDVAGLLAFCSRLRHDRVMQMIKPIVKEARWSAAFDSPGEWARSWLRQRHSSWGLVRMADPRVRQDVQLRLATRRWTEVTTRSAHVGGEGPTDVGRAIPSTQHGARS